MSHEPVLTIIIPCYNTPREIFSETLASINRSTWRDVRVIVVNDGSTDTDFLDAISECQFPVEVVHHAENQGPSAARNTGMARCSSPFFLLLDSDDLIAPTFIEKALWALISYPEWAFVNSWMQSFGAKHYRWERGFSEGKDFLVGNQMPPVSVIRREADRAVGGHDPDIRDGCEDWEYWMRHAAHGYWGGTIPEYLFWYRESDIPNRWPTRDNREQMLALRSMLRKRYPHLWRGKFPRVVKMGDPGNAPFSAALPFEILPPKKDGGKHVLLLLPCFCLGVADRFNVDLLTRLQKEGCHLTIATTAPNRCLCREQFAEYTEDVFHLETFLRPVDYSRFLRHLMESRGVDVVISNSTMVDTLLPFLGDDYPNVLFVAYSHRVDSHLHTGTQNRAKIHLNRLQKSFRPFYYWLSINAPDGAVVMIERASRYWRSLAR